MAENKFAEEKMTEEELDQVAGGNCYEIAYDSRFLNSLNGSCNRYGVTQSFFYKNIRDEVENAWKTVGIVFYPNTSPSRCDHNRYYLDGKEITQEEARQHAMNVTGHHMTEKDWNW